MGKFRCVCDTVISTSGEQPYEWLIVEEQRYGAAWDAGQTLEDVFPQTRPLFVCPVSGHVWIFWNGFGEPASCYAPTDVRGVDSDDP